MPDWSDPAQIQFDAGVFLKLMLTLLGLDTWEVINQLPFDWEVISRQREVHWPVGIYFYCKYAMWFAVIGVNISLNVTTKVNCQSLYLFSQFAGNTAIGASSALLMLRTIAIWNRKPIVMYPLIIIGLGQWAILFHGITTVQASWSDAASACVVDAVPPVFTELIFMYTMFTDLTVLILSLVGLLKSSGRSTLWGILFAQGIIYFVVSFTANILPTVFLLLNLNPIMNVMFTIPAALVSCIVSCRSFVALTNYRTGTVYVHSSQPNSYPLQGLNPNGPPTEIMRTVGNSGPVQNGVPAAMSNVSVNHGPADSVESMDAFETSKRLEIIPNTRRFTHRQMKRESAGIVVTTEQHILHDPEDVVDLERAMSQDRYDVQEKKSPRNAL